MELTLSQQSNTFLWSLAAGAVIALLYIAMEVLRELSPPSSALLAAEDILFTGIAAGINLLFALSQTQGYFRGYVLLAETAAFAVLYATLGKILRKTMRWIVQSLRRAGRTIGRIAAKMTEKGRATIKNVKKIKNPLK